MNSDTAVFVETAARLHFGVLDLGGTLGRLFGGIGAAAPAPTLLVSARPAATLEVTGEDAADRAADSPAGSWPTSVSRRTAPPRRPHLRASEPARACRPRIGHAARAGRRARAGGAVRARRSTSRGLRRRSDARADRRSARGRSRAAAWCSRAAGSRTAAAWRRCSRGSRFRRRGAAWWRCRTPPRA